MKILAALAGASVVGGMAMLGAWTGNQISDTFWFGGQIDIYAYGFGAFLAVFIERLRAPGPAD